MKKSKKNETPQERKRRWTREAQKRWRKKHPVEYRARIRKYAAANRDKMKKYQDTYKERHPERLRAAKIARYLKMKKDPKRYARYLERMRERKRRAYWRKKDVREAV